MDKNKSAHKLKNLPPIYYINLDGQPDRVKYMEDQFKYWEIENYTRISGYDGRDDDLGHIIKGVYPTMMTSGEIGCVTSHLKAIKHWFETSDSDCAMILEDDVDLELAHHWNFTWRQFFSKIPYDWDVVQLAIISTGNIHVELHQRFVNDFSTAAYIITRHHATKIIKNHIRGEKYKLDNGIKPRAVADDLIYNSGMSYACPIFNYKLELGSSIHPEHVDIYHRQCRNAIKNYWVQSGPDFNLDTMMNYDAYLSRISSPSGPKNNEV